MLGRDETAVTLREAENAGTEGIRSISRGLKVLQAINRHRSLSMLEISALCDLPYPTAWRIVDTLVAEQMIEREEKRNHFRPTLLVQTLSSGYHQDDALALASRIPITELTKDIKWPISMCTRVGMSMMIRESTHKIAPFTLNLYHPGYTIPILGSSSGKVFLAFSSDQDCDAVMDQLRATNPADAERMISRLRAEYRAIRERGYASYSRIRHTANPGKTSAISVPILIDGVCRGTMTLAFFSAAMTPKDASSAYLSKLNGTARAIGEALKAVRGA